MKKIIEKNLSVIIAVMIVLGMAVLGFGLDWDQSQILWKANASGWLIGGGLTLFAGGMILLITNTGSGG